MCIPGRSRGRWCQSSRFGAMTGLAARKLQDVFLSKQRGVAIIEFALILVLLIVLLMGVWNFGRAIYAYDGLVKGVRAAVRYVSTLNVPEDPSRLESVLKTLISCGEFFKVSPPPDCIEVIENSKNSIAVEIKKYDSILAGVNTNLVEVTVTGYQFEFTIPFIPLGKIEFGPISATMTSVGE